MCLYLFFYTCLPTFVLPHEKETALIYNMLKPVALCCAIATLAGCAISPIPVAENFQLTSQKKVRSAGHWNILSRDAIAQVVPGLEKAGFGPKSSVRVSAPANASSFDTAFREFLVTELVQQGWQVLTPGNNAVADLTLEYQTQIVKHNSERPRYIPGRYTMLAAGVAVLHNTTPAAGAFVVAGGLDLISGLNSGGPTPTELVLTTTVSGTGRYLSRRTDVYYVEQPDTALFSTLYSNPAVLQARTMKVVAQ